MDVVLTIAALLAPIVFAGLTFWGMFEFGRRDRRIWGRLIGGASIGVLACLIVRFSNESGDIDRMALSIFIAVQIGYILAGAIGWWSGRSVRG